MSQSALRFQPSPYLPRRSKRNNPYFVPNQQQMDIATRRIKGAFERRNGTIGAVSLGDLFDQLNRCISRRQDLGKTHKESAITVRCAFQKLWEGGEIVYSDMHHCFSVSYHFQRKQKQRKQSRRSLIERRAS